jgi:hypothetical protein
MQRCYFGVVHCGPALASIDSHGVTDAADYISHL